MVTTERIPVQSKRNTSIHEITSEVQAVVTKSGIREGTVTVFVPGATGAITTVEYEPGLVEDLKTLFDKIAPRGADYRHEEMWHDGNGHSHVRASLLGPSLSVPFENETLILGTWQQIIFLDFDPPPRSRQIVVQVMGE